MKETLVPTPCGLIPRKYLKEACRLLAIEPDSYEKPSILGWAIKPDTQKEGERYKEMINSSDARKGWDMPYMGSIPPSTTIKHQVESLVFKEYQRQYKDHFERFENYSKNTRPELRASVVRTILEENTQAKEGFLTEKEIKAEKAKKALKKKFEFLSS